MEKPDNAASPTVEGEPPPVDWERIKTNALKRIRSPSPRFIPLDAPEDNGRTERARNGSSIADAVQEAIAEVYGLWRSGAPMPQTLEDIETLVVEMARRRWKSWTKRFREQQKNLDLVAPTLSTRDLFEVICARDEQAKLFARIYEVLKDQPEARVMLYLILEQGYLFHESRLLAKEVHTSTTHVTKMKRRVVRIAHKIMREIAARDRLGGAP
jgi:hypothetical protein